MRTGNSKRAVAVALSAAFLLALSGDALGAHECPHHDGATAASHGTHGTDHGASHESDHASHGPCTCVGRCHAGTAPPHPVPSVAETTPPEAPPLDFAPVSDRPDRPAVPPFTLPWANAPPSL